MKQRYFIQLCFDGTNYHGWQIQANAMSVQSIINKALSTILREEIKIIGAGRTDTGVHAKFYIAHFDSIQYDLDSEEFKYRLNSFLHRDIAVQKIYKVKPDAHSRFDAISRIYEYHICRNKAPFLENFAYYFHGNLDIRQMNRAAKILLEYEDFSSFCKSHSGAKTNLCKIFSAKWYEKDDMLVFKIKADRFLRNMVRAIAGTLLEIGKNKLSLKEFRQIIESKNRSKAGMSVPAKGLFLVNIEYKSF